MNELKVGLLTLMAIASLVVVSFKITSNDPGFGDYIKYRAILSDATGIYENASIRVAGIVAGRIKKIELSENQTQAIMTFEILSEIKITKHSKIKIKSVGFLGDKYVDINPGSTQAARLSEGELIPVEGGGGFEELGKDAGDVLKEVKQISKAIKEALYDDQNKNVVKGVMLDVREFAKNAKDVSASLKRLIGNNEGKLNDTIENLQKVASQLAYETDRYSDGSLMNDMEQLKPILANINQASSDIKAIIGDVKDGKGTVGKLLRDEQVVDQVNQTLAGVNRIVGRINNFKTDLSIYSGVNTEFGGRTDFNLDLIPSPERFFRFGVVVSEYGPSLEQNTTTITSVDGGDEVEKNKRKINEDNLKFNLQIGRRLGPWGLRAGLIETTGGVGADYYLPHYGSRTWVEAFDYQEDAGPNIRIGTELKIWNVLYTKIMAEDVFSETDNQSYVLSAGLKFTDDDLAALIAVFTN